MDRPRADDNGAGGSRGGGSRAEAPPPRGASLQREGPRDDAVSAQNTQSAVAKR